MKTQFLKFLLTSGLAAGVNILSRILFSLFVDYEIAIVLAYIIGMITAYVLARAFVFDKSGKAVSNEMAGFVFVNMIALLQVWGVSILLARWAFPAIGFDFYPDLTAHIIGVASPAFTSYFGHKHISFGKSREP